MTTGSPPTGRGSPAIGNPGRAARELPAGCPPLVPEPPDHVLSEHSTPALEIRAASVRGLMHRYLGSPRQDAYSVTGDPVGGGVVVVVCDGVGSLPRSQDAARFVTDRLPALYLADRDWEKAVRAVNAELAAFADQVGEGLEPDRVGMATTVVAVAVSSFGDSIAVDAVRSDDSTLWQLTAEGGWSEIAAMAVADGGQHTGSVRALPTREPRLCFERTTLEGKALFVMTDGVDCPLRGAAEVRERLAEWWAAPPPIFEFGSQVGFARKGHMDDRTVVGLWIRGGKTGPP